MRTLILIAAVACVCLGAFALRADAAEEKLLMSFEKDEISKWPNVTIADGKHTGRCQFRGNITPGSFGFSVFWRGEFKGKFGLLSAKGNASHGEYALSRVLKYPREPNDMAPYYPMSITLMTTFGWAEKCFPTDWSGYERFRMDVWSEKGVEYLWLMIEDDLVEPAIVRTFKIPAGKWVTVEIDLEKAIAVRGLDLKKMANIRIKGKGRGNVLIDNIRLAKKKAQLKHALLKDASSMKPPEPPKMDKASFPKISLKPDRSPLKNEKPIVVQVNAKNGARIIPQGWITAFDNKRMMLAYGEGTGTGFAKPFLKILQTFDGGKTWKGLDGGSAPTTIKYRNADHGTNPGNAIDSLGSGIYVSSIGCCGFRSAPRLYAFMLMLKGAKGWEARIPPKGRSRDGYNVGSKTNLIDSDMRHCSYTGMTLRLDSGILWHVWGHIGRWSSMGIHAKYSVDDGVTWHSWQPGKSAGIPGSFGARTGKLYSYKRCWATEWRDGLAVFWHDWQDKNKLQWSRFDGKKWSKVETIKEFEKARSKAKCAKTYGTAVRLGKEELFVAAAIMDGVLHWNGKSWKHEIPEAGSQGYLTVAGKTVVLVNAGPLKYKWGKGWHVDGANLRYWKRTPQGKWEGPTQISDGTYEIFVYRGMPNFRAPRIAPPNFVPVVWSKKGENNLRIHRIPVP